MASVSRSSAKLCAAIALLVAAGAATAAAQEAPEPLDPASPLAPLPDLGVDWPDMNAAEPAPIEPHPAEATKAQEQKPPSPQEDVDAERRYRVVIEGLGDIGDPEFRHRFDALSTLMQDENKAANTAQIDRRARQDEALMRELLRASGYYAANVVTRVDPGEAGRLTVTLTVEAGARYSFSSVELPHIEQAGDKAEALRKAFGIQAGGPINAEKVTAAVANLKLALGRQGFAFAKVGEPAVVIDHSTQSGKLTIGVDPEGAKRFGKIEIKGERLFSAKHLGRIARFRPGRPYDAALLDDFRRALIATGLVSSVELKAVPVAEPDVVDITVKLEPAPPRTVAGEIGYGTGEGFRLEASWQHRNLIRPEGAVTVRGVAGTQEQSLGVTLRRNNFKKRDRVLTAQVVASHTDRDAYEARTFTIGAGLERQTNIIWQKKWTWSYGLDLTTSDERDVIRATGQPRRRTFFIASVPTSLSYDGSNDLLDPTRGYRLAGRLSPEASLQGGVFTYVKAQVDGSAYLPVADKVVMAGRVRLGSIVGAARDRIAPSRRFYAGGGGSVRGYGYQDIGPLDVDGDPVGGRSLAEFSIEARVRFGNFGVVPFLDGGNLYTSTLPRFTGLRYGAGIGARYYTNFGPIRVDVGTPINRRPGDARIAVYVSLGQAF